MDTQTGGRAPTEEVNDNVEAAHAGHEPAGRSTAYSRELGSRIRICRGATGRQEFADALGVHLNTVGKMERGLTVPDAQQLIAIARLGSRGVEWLVTGEHSSGHLDEGVPHAVHAVPHGNYVFIPHFDINASAGNGNLFNHVESVVAMRPFDQAYIRGELGIKHDEIALISIIGSSMQPLLHSEDTVLVDLRASQEMFSDGIHVIRLDEALLVKQVQRLPGRVYRIRSLNPDYEPFEIRPTEEAERDFAIIGRVRWGGVTIK
jgi:phage repressor protein C with HTH and peptisase S24 domain